MTTLAKVIVAALLAILFTSCQFDFDGGKRGNGNVVTEKRNTSESFTEIKASEGLDVYVSQGSETSIRVEADENIIELIRTEVRDGMLKVDTEDRIGRAKSKKIFVSMPTITRLVSNSGADIRGKETLNVDTIYLDCSSGADLNVTVQANEVHSDASSGSDIVIAGKAELLVAEASSGADIRAKGLEVKRCIAKASSGADIIVNTTEELTASASSGGDVRYIGDPQKVKKEDGYSGSINKN